MVLGVSFVGLGGVRGGVRGGVHLGCPVDDIERSCVHVSDGACR